jgi:Na+/H+ antiporter NhaD/arsenite permease-like protein
MTEPQPVVDTRLDARDPDVPEPKGRLTPWIYAAALLAAVALAVTGERTDAGIQVLGGNVPFAFVLFVLVLLGVAFFHHHTLWVALGGAAVITTYTGALAPGFHWSGEQVVEYGRGLDRHFLYEGEHTLLNLGALLLGFSLLAKYFEHSRVPDNLPRLLPKSSLWNGFVLLALVWFISSFLDNIAAAMIGGVMARSAFKGRVTVGYVAAIVAASNAGGAWSVLGDTTTTMMWIDGVKPEWVARGFLASATALLCFGLLSSAHQNKTQPMELHSFERKPLDWASLGIVVLILGGAVFANFMFADNGPWHGFFAGGPWYGVWAAILLAMLVRRPAWGEIPGAAKGCLFLLSLVWCASLMPVEQLPTASWQTAFGLGFVSAVFDNIPLTKLGLEQGGYDWGMLAYTVGFGGSMIWFGSSAGVAISKDFPEARNTGRYLKEGWPVAFAYVVGFFLMLWVLGFTPHPSHKGAAPKEHSAAVHVAAPRAA